MVNEYLLESLEAREQFLYVLGIADGFNTDKLNKGFCSNSKELIKQFITLVQLSGYHYTLGNKTERGTQYVYYSKQNQKRALISLGQGKFTKLKKIRNKSNSLNVYDLTVKNNSNFIAGNHGSILISNSIYPDCRQEFRDADDNAFRIGNWDVDKVGYYTPYLEGDKLSILRDGAMLCESMGLNFDEVYKRTNTSYKPIYIEYPMGSTMEDMKTGPEGEWCSDYRSASSVERIEAFINLGRPDPVQYADETGKVSWEVARDAVKKVLEDYKK